MSSSEERVHVEVAVLDNTARAEAVVQPLQVAADASVGTLVHDGKTYTGEYTAIPRPSAQTFETKDCLMREDFTVTEIRLHKAPNQHGTTITIGD